MQLPTSEPGADCFQVSTPWYAIGADADPMPDHGFGLELMKWELELAARPPNSMAVSLACLAGVNHSLDAQQPYAGTLERRREGLWAHERRHSRRQEPLARGDAAWDRFRRIQDPARRRAAIYWAAVGLNLEWAIEALPEMASLGPGIRTRKQWWQWEFMPSLPATVRELEVQLSAMLAIDGGR
jgi:hypothetical protein